MTLDLRDNLRDGRVGPFSGVRWPPSGEWLQATGAPGRACVDRVHACRAEDLPDWMDGELWCVELAGDVTVDCGKLVADRGRLIERLEAWDASFMAAFAEACAPRARDAALAVLTDGSPGHAALAASQDAEALTAVCAQLTGLDPEEERAAGYAGDAARHVLGARAEPATTPDACRRERVHSLHAAVFAEDDLGAVARELAWQVAWLARQLGLHSA